MFKRISDSVYSKTEQQRHECEVRYSLSKNANWIKEHLAGVKEKRGFDAYKRLRDDVEKLWKK